MKCLSLWQPWATLIAIAAKSNETRSWYTSYRGPLLIQASKKRDDDSLRLCLEEPFRSALVAGGIEKIGDLPFGSILCLVTQSDCQKIICDSDDYATLANGDRVHEPEKSFGNYDPGRFAHIYTNLRRFLSPIPITGHQGIFNVPDALVAAQLACLPSVPLCLSASVPPQEFP